MSNKVLTLSLIKGSNDWYSQNWNISLCLDGINKYFEIPKEASVLYLSIHLKKRKHSVKIKHLDHNEDYIKVNGKKVDFLPGAISALYNLVDEYGQSTYWVRCKYVTLIRKHC